MAEQSFLTLRKLGVGYGRTEVLRDIDLNIDKGEFVALLGSSGCGKTTLLRSIAGFVRPSIGSIAVSDREVTHLPPEKRGMALVFQSYALWPHMTVSQNIGYGLKLRRYPRQEIARRVSEMEGLLGLSGLSARKPAALSGGQRQRVALGRALAIDPEILLLDEPLSNLDARIRLTVRHEIRALQRRLGITAIHVTHDREEAMVMADRIVILNAGRIAQQGSPEEVYNRPASAFVAAFMGAENVVRLNGAPEGERFRIAASDTNRTCLLTPSQPGLGAGRVEARFRAEAAQLQQRDGGEIVASDGLALHGRVLGVSYPGGVWRHVVAVEGGEVLVDAPRAFAVGDAVSVVIPAAHLFVFGVDASVASAIPVSRTPAAAVGVGEKSHAQSLNLETNP
ncbi:ABC transporter ATP-binding protein [Rhizobium sp. RU36D]|uniref:ABC transporter ATP-binding protein n=1 Tax=Rhizobium sp. RU36D TaxID=1907415 RepID=UPI0009D8640A|nr:ABC transporter ATP-binding protein [Rhizobium sp. RU36D]SMC85872.1 carbohydrate ABC transporter ATP-binding protein, CUT1 family [Rhizobium sp. RU36D]